MIFDKKINIFHNNEKKSIMITIKIISNFINRTEAIKNLRLINNLLNNINNKHIILEQTNIVKEYSSFYIKTNINENNITFTTNNINCYNLIETIKYYLENELSNLDISNNIDIKYI